MTRDEFIQAALRCEAKLFKIAYLSLRSQADCEDAVQEALLKAWQSRSTLMHPEYFETWIVRILLNECTNLRRASQKVTASEAPSAPMTFVPPDTDLRDAVRALDEKLRKPLLLHYLAGYSITETAHILHLTGPQVRWRLEKAKAQLRMQLGERETEDLP